MTQAPDTLTLTEAAQAAGYAYETFRKVWRRLATPSDPLFVGFPMPFRLPPAGKRGSIVWRKEAVEAWRLAREAALGAGGAPVDRTPPRKAPGDLKNRRLVRERAELMQLMNLGNA